MPINKKSFYIAVALLFLLPHFVRASPTSRTTTLTPTQEATFKAATNLKSKLMRVIISLSKNFRDQYTNFTKGLSNQQVPLVVIRSIGSDVFRGFYVYTDNHDFSRHDMADDTYKIMAEISHIPVVISVISLRHAYEDPNLPHGVSMQKEFGWLVDKCKWLDALFSDYPDHLESDVRVQTISLIKETITFLDAVIASGTLKKEALEKYLATVRPYLFVMLKKANESMSSAIHAFAKKLKADLGPEKWDKIFIVLQTDKGMEINNILADVFLSYVSEDKRKTNYVKTTDVTMTPDEVRTNFAGSFLADRIMKQMVFAETFESLTSEEGGSASSAASLQRLKTT